MGFATDKLFYEILSADVELAALVGDRIYNTAITKPDFEAENEPVPYIIITFDGLNNDDSTKDDPYEGDTDIVQIGITIAADTREQLATIEQHVRQTIHDDFAWVQRFDHLADTDDELLADLNDFQLMVVRDYERLYRSVPYSYRFSEQAVQYDSMKPCFWQVLNYSCDVRNEITEDDEQNED